MKLCTKCGKWKSPGEFYRNRRSKDGRCAHCKTCSKASSRKWYAANKRRAKTYGRKYYHEHKEERNAYTRRYYQANKEKMRRVRVRVTQRRRARLARTKYGVTDHDMIVLLRQHEVCPYCEGTFEDGGGQVWDHVVPLSRGGSNAAGNMLPACRRCNASKGPKLLDEWTDRWYERQ